eukprot:CAMPEP_0175122598 /NCGR_PEP_ID=MMETSP0087-20121206/1802_1 /TAXON_ID=136419 /ORGANISM="Unknown Unknown, Strain D1" /LENGTH=338 /DNA_ID=CAMNT_0016404247 /DNA_START=89 /DNA_END=1105 /DNA_ORIENTATION=+
MQYHHRRVCGICDGFGHMHADPVTQFNREGLLLEQSGLTAAQVEQTHDTLTAFFQHLMYTVRTLGLEDELRDRGFHEIKTRHEGRYDFPISSFAADMPWLTTQAPWLPAVRSILGADCRLMASGCMLSLPGSKHQPEHSDGDHLSMKKHLPCYALNVFVPLCDVNVRNGCTEFAPATHVLHNWATPMERVNVSISAGHYLLFDYRLRHRGLGNMSDEARPLLYITYSIPSFADNWNFSSKRYKKLPSVPKPLSREERVAAKKKREQETRLPQGALSSVTVGAPDEKAACDDLGGQPQQQQQPRQEEEDGEQQQQQLVTSSKKTKNALKKLQIEMAAPS